MTELQPPQESNSVATEEQVRALQCASSVCLNETPLLYTHCSRKNGVLEGSKGPKKLMTYLWFQEDPKHGEAKPQRE